MNKALKACAFAAVLLVLCIDDVQAEDFCQCEDRIAAAAKIDVNERYVNNINSGVDRPTASINCGMIRLEPQYSVVGKCGHLLTKTDAGLVAPCKGSRWVLPAMGGRMQL